jgi:hypothetical protein
MGRNKKDFFTGALKKVGNNALGFVDEKLGGPPRKPWVDPGMPKGHEYAPAKGINGAPEMGITEQEVLHQNAKVRPIPEPPR